MSSLERFARICEIIALFVAAGALSFAVQEYQRAEADRRDERTMQIYESLTSNPAFDTLGLLEKGLSSHMEDAEELAREINEKSPELSLTAMEIAKFLHNSELEGDEIQTGSNSLFFSPFSAMVNCLNRERCNPRLAYVLLAPVAAKMTGTFDHVVALELKLGMQRFGADFCGAEAIFLFAQPKSDFLDIFARPVGRESKRRAAQAPKNGSPQC